MLTRRPRSLSRRPRLEAVRPLPRLDATPPVTKRCLVETGRDERGAVPKVRLPWSLSCGKSAGPRGIRISARPPQTGHQHRTHTVGAAPELEQVSRSGFGSAAGG